MASFNETMEVYAMKMKMLVLAAAMLLLSIATIVKAGNQPIDPTPAVGHQAMNQANRCCEPPPPTCGNGVPCLV